METIKENALVIILCICLIAIFCTFVAINESNNKAIVEAIKNGSDPSEAACAIRSFTDGCDIVLSKKY